MIENRNPSGWAISDHNWWNSSAGGESAFIAFNPDDPRPTMGGSYQGTIELLVKKKPMKAKGNDFAHPISGTATQEHEIPVPTGMHRLSGRNMTNAGLPWRKQTIQDNQFGQELGSDIPDLYPQ